jgi:LysM repeat protein
VRHANRLPVLAAVLAAVTLLGAEALAAQSPCGGHHTIRDGDTLVAIAARCGVTVPALLAANPAVRGDGDLAVGGALRVPDPRDRQPTPQQACGAFYTIQAGDTLAGIARKCGITVPLLVAANGPLDDPLALRVGGQMRIPNVPRSAIADTLTWAATPPAPDTVQVAEELTRVEGTLASGTPCMLLRATDGRTIALAGARPGSAFRPGQAVVVLGVETNAEACGRTPALDVRILYRPEP